MNVGEALEGQKTRLMRLLRWPIHVSVNLELPAFIQRLFDRPLEPVVVTSVRLRHLVNSEVGEPDSLIAVLEFNEQNADPDDPEHVDLNQLQNSIEENGTYFIWTCSCGAPGCAGRFHGVQVAHSNDETTWNDLDSKRKYVFQTAALRDAFRRGMIEGRNHLNDRPKIEPTPEQNATAYRNDE